MTSAEGRSAKVDPIVSGREAEGERHPRQLEGQKGNTNMRISQTRIRTPNRHLRYIRRKSRIVLAVDDSVLDEDILKRIGFTGNLSDGDAVLPSPDFGPTSRFNAEGKVKVHKDRPMETAYRQVEWTWEEWNGPYDRLEQSKIVDVPYRRYPRTPIPPPAIELTIRKKVDGGSLLVSPPFVYRDSEEAVSYTHLRAHET